MSLTIQGDDFNAPTNPQLTSGSSDFSDGDRVYTAIVSHGAVSVAITGFGGTVTENSNLTNTKGFRIKCYDSLTTTGVRFNPADWNATTGKFTTNDYFVLLYSDNPLQHHLAKITEVKTEDLQGDAFEFEPKLGNEIPKDTKFIIFQVTQNTDIVAISLGMKQDSSLGDSTHFQGQLARRMVVARPLFYFYDGLDKEGELDHNTKYFAMRECGTANSYTLAKTDPSRAFVTVQDFGKTVIDYSKYSHSIKLTDKLRDLDAVTSTATNEGVGYSQNTVDYDLCYKNARRIADDEINSAVYTGETRYLNYAFSPTKSNVMYNVYDHVNTESIEGKGGFAETSILDNGRVVPKKIKEFNSYRVRHNIHRADFNAFFPLKATYSSSSSAFVFSFNTEYDLGTVLNVGDEVKLGDKILIVNAFGTLSGTTQTITFQNDTSNPYARGENDGVFTAQSITPSSNEVLHRRAYNATDGTLMLDTHLLNGRFSKMYVAFTSLNHKERFATITACDAIKNIITLSFTGDSYNSNPLSFTKGQYQLFIERFNGEIENIETKKEEGQSIVEIKGRDNFSKLLSPIVNTNTLFSEDIIYSSNSPYNKLGNIHTGSTYSFDLATTTLQTGRPFADTAFTNAPNVGDKLFSINGYIGEITAIGSYIQGGVAMRSLTFTPSMTELNSEAVYVDVEKNYVLMKALGSNSLATNKPSSLTGSANKGLIFTSGNKIKKVTLSATTNSNTTVNINASGEDTSDLEVGMIISGHTGIPSLATIVSIDSSSAITISASATNSATESSIVFFGGESTTLVSTSANTNEGAIGYAINSPSSISNDFAFQSKLKDEHGNAGESSFDTVNTLIDFEVVSTNKKDNSTELELAPYIPITLGRKSDYYFDTTDFTFTSAGNVVAVSSFSTDSDGFVTSDSSSYTLKRDNIIFVGDSSSTTTEGTKTFVGKIKGLVISSLAASDGSVTHRQFIYLDRSIHAFSINEKLYVAQRKTNDLVLINGQHLWGGKINTLPHPTISSDLGVVPLNLESINGSTDYNAKHGQMYYKSKDFAIGSFSADSGQLNEINTNALMPRFYNTATKLNYYTSNYQFKPNVGSDNLIEYDKTDSSYRTMPLDIRGNTTPFGSKSNHTRIHTNQISNLPKSQFASVVEETFGNQDESASRLFLYAVSDLMPYSSLRRDSIFNKNANFNTLKYNLFLLENNKQKDNSLTQTNRLSLTDNNYQTINFQADIQLKNLKRFGLMRLTEVCFDFMFNKVNPEKKIDTKDTNKQQAPPCNVYDITELAGSDKGSIDTITWSGSSPIITFDDNQTLADADQLWDASTGHIIGTVATGQGGTKKVFTLNSIIKSNNGAFATNAIKVSKDSIAFAGRKGKDSFLELQSLHPLKCCIIPQLSIYGSDSGDAAYESSSSNRIQLITDAEIYLPLVIQQAGSEQTLQAAADATDLLGITNSYSHINAGVYYGMLGVSLDRFSIEDGGKTSIEKGATTGALKETKINTWTGGNEQRFLLVASDSHFKQKVNSEDSSDSYVSSRPYNVDGSYMVFKPRLCIASQSASDIKSSNGLVKKYTITPSATDGNGFLKMVDLTGCYLVPEEGTTLSGTTFTDGTNISSKRMNNVRPTLGKLIYVISHEVSSSDADNHIIVTDIALDANTEYRIMEPNETCLYDFFPDKIHLNTLSSSYTKIHDEDKVYDTKHDYTSQEGKSLEGGGTEANEAILSMFVIVDTDKQSTNTGLVIKDCRNFMATNFPNGDYNMLFSDGDNKKKIQFTSVDASDFSALILSEGFNGKGIVSVSDTFTVSSKQELKINPNRACIGTTVSVGLEGEDLINELLEEEGIVFQTTPTQSPMYLAPNYQGVDLYSAIRYITEKKGMKLTEENGVFNITPEGDDSRNTNITINDSGDYLISEFDKVTTLFDFYNEVIVYGASHKSSRRDIRSIQKRGRKTFEKVDASLLTQEETDKEAQKLLNRYSRVNEKLSFTMQNKGINQLRVGDVVNVEIPRENIGMSTYVVLELEHQLSGFIKLQLGRFSKDLSDMFSELIISSKTTNAALRSNISTGNDVSFSLIDTLNTKELKLLIRKRDASGASRTLGFSTQLGFSTNSQLGFSGGAITITDLLEEDLT